MFWRIIKFFAKTFCLLGLVLGLIGTGVGYYAYKRISKDLPQIEKIGDYAPKSVTSIYSSDGTLIAETYEERRYPVELKDIPLLVRNAFLAAEDSNFYSHPGIDIISIFRAIWVNLRHKSTRQGASTITQQIVKSLVLTREKTFTRKVKEAILSYRLEKYLSKDEILTIYLNEVYLGETSYGVKAAAKVFFHKSLEDLTIAEAAFIAAMPQKPSELSRPEKRQEAFHRQRYVIDQMLKNNMISSIDAAAAKEQKLIFYPPDEQTIFHAPYFAGYVIKNMNQVFAKIDPKITALNPGGFTITTSVDLNATALAEKAVYRGLREVDKRQGLRFPKEPLTEEKVKDILARQIESLGPDFEKEGPPKGRVLKARVVKVGPEPGVVHIALGNFEGQIDTKKAGWAKKMVRDEQTFFGDPSKYIKAGQLIEFTVVEEDPAAEKPAGEKEKAGKSAPEPAPPAVKPLQLQLDQTPELESAFVVTNTQTGAIVAMIGGYDYQRSQFNRTTLARRQPGSSFKPFVYLTAIEALNYTPSTLVPDSPISLVAGDGKLWTPGNFDGKFLGPITMRVALQRSRNVVSVYLIQRLGMDRVIETAQRLGLSTPIPRNLSISLGSAEVEMLELVRAYGAFATEGWLADPLFITSVRDRYGNLIYEGNPKQRRVIAEDDAFIMAHMMKGVIDRGTATVLKKLNRPIAGKTGTTNDQMDAWFLGYTPEYVAGVWVGFDRLKPIGKDETGGKAAAPIYLYFMQDFLQGVPPTDFDPTDGVYPVPINVNTGRTVSEGDEGAFIEYFKIGSEPHQSTADEVEAPKDYLSSDEF